MSKKKTDIKDLLEAGAHFGHRSSRWNAKMKPYIHSKRGGIHIIDLEQTRDQLQAAVTFAEQVAASGKEILFVGTKNHIAPVVEQAAQAAGMPHVTQRWFGGILTNFDTISGRARYYKKLAADLESGDLTDTYNKRELGKFQEQQDKLAKLFAGIADMEKLPGALFVTDVLTDKTAVQEANRLGIPIIGIVDTNGNPETVDYVIAANDDAVKTVRLIAEEIRDAIIDGRESFHKKPAQKPSKDKEKEATDTKKQPASKKTEKEG